MGVVHRKVAEGPRDKYGLCPCGSGTVQVRCCKKGNDWLRTPVSTTPPAPRTGTEVSKCYARALGDCAGVLTKEHYISAAILKQMGEVGIKGFHWQTQGEFQPMPVSALTAKVLCERHNRSLSGLDAQAELFFRTLCEMHESLANGTSSVRDFAVFSGEDLERWVLKSLCGLASGGSLSAAGTNLGKREIPREWLDLLFSTTTWPDTWGLYFLSGNGAGFEAIREVGLAPFYDYEADQIRGAYVAFYGMRFVLTLASTEFGLAAMHRPGHLVFRGAGLEKVARLTWVQGGGADVVLMTSRQLGGVVRKGETDTALKGV